MIRGRLGTFAEAIEGTQLLGEFVIVIEGNREDQTPGAPELNSLEDIYAYFKNRYGLSRNALRNAVMKKDGFR